jgi:hypothetical protein
MSIFCFLRVGYAAGVVVSECALVFYSSINPQYQIPQKTPKERKVWVYYNTMQISPSLLQHAHRIERRLGGARLVDLDTFASDLDRVVVTTLDFVVNP